MLPTVRLIAGALVAAIAFVMMVGGGLVALRVPYKNFGDTPDINRPLVRHAFAERMDGPQSQIMAYARRSDELHRLLDLPVSPGRGMAEAVADIPAEETATDDTTGTVGEQAAPAQPARSEEVAALWQTAAAPVVPAPQPAPLAEPAAPDLAAPDLAAPDLAVVASIAAAETPTDTAAPEASPAIALAEVQVGADVEAAAKGKAAEREARRRKARALARRAARQAAARNAFANDSAEQVRLNNVMVFERLNWSSGKSDAAAPAMDR